MRTLRLALAVLALSIGGIFPAPADPGQWILQNWSNARPLPAALVASILANAGITLGNTAVSLGNTATTLAGLALTAAPSLALRDTSAAFDVTMSATSSTPLTGGRSLVVDVVNGARTVKLGSNLTVVTDPGAVSGTVKSNGSGTFAAAGQSDLPSGYAAPTAHGLIVGENTSAPVAVGPCGTANQIIGYPATAADPACMSHILMLNTGQAALGPGITQYFAGGQSSTATDVGMPLPFGGTLSNLGYRLVNPPGAGQTVTVTVTSGACGSALSASAMTCQVGGASAKTCTDVAHTLAVTANQCVGFQVITSAGATNTGIGAISAQLTTP